MNTQEKIKEGQILLDNIDNYRPLASPIDIETNHKVTQLIKIPCSTQWCRGNFTYAIPWRSIPIWLLLNQRSAVVYDKQVRST